MNKILATSETISVLDEIHSSLERYQRQAKELTKTAAKAGEINRARFDRELSGHESELNRLVQEQESSLESQRARLNEYLSSRAARIDSALSNAKSAGLSRIAKDEDREKYLVQKGVLDAERLEESLVAEAEKGRISFEKQAEEQHEDLVALGSRLRRVLANFPLLLPLLKRKGILTAEEAAMDHHAMLDSSTQVKASARESLARLERFVPVAPFRFLPVYLVLPGTIALMIVWRLIGPGMFAPLTNGEMAALQGLGIYLAANVVTTLLIRKRCGRIASDANKAAALQANAPGVCERWTAQEIARFRKDAQTQIGELNRKWLLAINDADEQRKRFQEHLDSRKQRAQERLERIGNQQRVRMEETHGRSVAELRAGSGQSRQALVSEHEQRAQTQAARAAADYSALISTTRAQLAPLFDRLAASASEMRIAFPSWENLAGSWNPSTHWQTVIPFGSLSLRESVSEADLAQVSPNEIATLEGPLSLDLENRGCLLIESDAAGRASAMAALNDLLFRIITNAPPGQVALTIFDPVGLGQNFPAFPRLADFECKVLNGQIWTQQEHIEQRLSELNLHIERVVQVCLRDEYANIFEYNRAAGNISERLHILVLADFPNNLSDSTLRLLSRIVSAGPRCGVFTFLHHAGKSNDAAGLIVDQLRENSVSLKFTGNNALVEGQPQDATAAIEEPPASRQALPLLEAVVRANINATEVRVPFAEVAPDPAQVWTRSVSEELRVAIGRAGPNKLQELVLGKGTRQHALIAGKTGSGKSTLFHVIITNLALWCSPAEVEFYLIDFKKGIEFKSYATQKLPHARVIAIESDREFGLSVLQRVDQELRRRGELFRKAGVQDMAGYRKTGNSLPRTLLLIDEFQEFFTEDDRIAQSASMLLDRIVRQGRAFGIHVILGSQTLGGAYTLARSTLGQMVIRIALQSNEADASLIMDEGNSAARLLSRPGEGIYNDRGGSADANSAFQVVWLPEEERDQRLAAIRAKHQSSALPMADTFVFEGNAPGDPRHNQQLLQLLKDPASDLARNDESRVWLGEPNSIKGPTEVVFANRTGSNLLIVGQSEEEASTILAMALYALSNQFTPGSARFILIDGSRQGAPSHEIFNELMPLLPPGTEVIKPPLNGASDLLAEKMESPDSKPLFVLIHNIQNLRQFKIEDEFAFSNSDSQSSQAPEILTKILADGPRRGIHSLISVDTATNANRFLGRRNLGEFEMRALFQMNANDSAALSDDPTASGLGLHKALLYRAETGNIEIFRPYARPDFKSLSHANSRA